MGCEPSASFQALSFPPHKALAFGFTRSSRPRASFDIPYATSMMPGIQHNHWHGSVFSSDMDFTFHAMSTTLPAGLSNPGSRPHCVETGAAPMPSAYQHSKSTGPRTHRLHSHGKCCAHAICIITAAAVSATVAAAAITAAGGRPNRCPTAQARQPAQSLR